MPCENDGVWKVYDVVIEGVSLINNYRSQFREILADKTPESLLETLRKKVGKALPERKILRRNPHKNFLNNQIRAFYWRSYFYNVSML